MGYKTDKTEDIKKYNRVINSGNGNAGLDDIKKEQIITFFYQGFDATGISEKLNLSVLVVRHFLSNQVFNPPNTAEQRINQAGVIEYKLFTAIDVYHLHPTRANLKIVKEFTLAYTKFVV